MVIRSEDADTVPATISSIISHRRLIISLTEGPVKSCSIFVTKEGITSNAAAIGSGINMPSSPIATVGSPIPVTPFTKPARINTNER
ncbi:hypothetical protein D3C71_2088010 [compost metagenome]